MGERFEGRTPVPGLTWNPKIGSLTLSITLLCLAIATLCFVFPAQSKEEPPQPQKAIHISGSKMPHELSSITFCPGPSSDYRSYNYAMQQHYRPYMHVMQQRMRSHWCSEKKFSENQNTSVIYTLNRFGEVSKLKLNHSSGDHDLDRAALAAVRTSSPFASLPSGANETIDIEFRFDKTFVDDRN